MKLKRENPLNIVQHDRKRPFARHLYRINVGRSAACILCARALGDTVHALRVAIPVVRGA